MQRNCDICTTQGFTNTALYDGKTVYGPWANMCQAHFGSHGTGLGVGRGQRLVEPNAKAGPPVREDGVSFEDWMERVDASVGALVGISVHDLADCTLRDWYNAGMKPGAAALEALASDDTFAELMDGAE